MVTVSASRGIPSSYEECVDEGICPPKPSLLCQRGDVHGGWVIIMCGVVAVGHTAVAGETRRARIYVGW